MMKAKSKAKPKAPAKSGAATRGRTKAAPQRRSQAKPVEVEPTEAQYFYDFLGGYLGNGGGGSTVEQCVSAFRAYWKDVERLRERLAPSIAEAERGDVHPLDVEALIDRVERRIAAERGRA